MNDGTVAERKVGDVFLQITIARRDRAHVDISYAYSRPARESADSLFVPGRSLTAAGEVPEQLFEEICALEKHLDDSAFAEVFNADAMRRDRLLNWLMRSVLVPRAELQKAAEQGIMLIGDAAHHVPILGSHGANMAIEDAVALASHIDQHGREDLAGFYASRYNIWTEHVDSGKARLAAMHDHKSRAYL